MYCGIWQHYKGGYYQVLGVGAHSETGEKFVVSISLSGIDLEGPRMRLRPIEIWSDLVKWPDGFHYTRFKYIGDSLKE